jgi:hypothetical protein
MPTLASMKKGCLQVSIFDLHISLVLQEQPDVLVLTTASKLREHGPTIGVSYVGVGPVL